MFLANRRFKTSCIIFALIASQLAQATPTSLRTILNSRAGRLIFAELIEGSLASREIIGSNVANPSRRIERLIEVLESSRMEPTAKKLEERLTRIYESASKRNSKKAKELFETKAGEVGPLNLAEADRRMIRDLVSKEFTDDFLLELTPEDLVGEFRESAIRSEIAALTPQEKALVYWETQKNGASIRSVQSFEIEHFEIPLELVTEDFATRIAPELRNSLIFEKDGRKHVRWLINPEDTKHYKKLEKYLASKGADTKHYKRFIARQTASRSYVMFDPLAQEHIVFSAKVSTNKTGGNWTDKVQPFEDAYEARRATDFIQTQQAQRKFTNIVAMDEPAMLGIQDADQAMLVRVLGELPDGDVTYLPGFSAMHEDLGVRIAKANGYDDPSVFWNEHYNKPLGRALAELAARTGLTYDSPHSQNFLIEMVGINPTGRIVLRDFGDTYAMAEFFEATGNTSFLKRWDNGNIMRKSLEASIGILHGNKMPSWMSNASYKDWGVDFYHAFEAEFAVQTGVPQSLLNETAMTRNGYYFSKSYSTKHPRWKAFFERLGRNVATDNTAAPQGASSQRPTRRVPRSM